MNLLKLLGLQKKTTAGKAHAHNEILHLWEDDYLMLELLSHDNLAFARDEAKRINDFGREHFDGAGFTNITPINEKPIKTIDKLIEIAKVESIMAKAGLERVSQFHMQGIGLLQGNKAPLGFGTNTFAIMCDNQNNHLKHIWVTGRTTTEEERQTLITALLSFGKSFNFIAIDWYQGESYSLTERPGVEAFVKNCC